MGPEWVMIAIWAVYVAVIATYISLVVNVGKIRRMLASAGFDEDRTCGECLLPVPAQARVCGHCGRDLVTV
ncbi:MAG: hypothetical protein ACM3OO_07480 [Planctomycetaceae bacterium]|jgi:hypothetical protein